MKNLIDKLYLSKYVVYSVTLIVFIFSCIFFTKEILNDYRDTTQYVYDKFDQELVKLNTMESIDKKRATELITLAVERDFENAIISTLIYFLYSLIFLISIVSVLFIYREYKFERLKQLKE